MLLRGIWDTTALSQGLLRPEKGREGRKGGEGEGGEGRGREGKERKEKGRETLLCL